MALNESGKDIKTTFSFYSSSEGETLDLGRMLGKQLLPGITVLISGDLGSGKTVFVRGVGEGLGVARVRSPSFTLVNEYRTPTLDIIHVDLYRLDSDGVDDLGLEDYLEDGCVLFVEWAELWKNPPEADVINISVTAEGEKTRKFVFSSVGEKAERILRNFSSRRSATAGASPK